MGARKECGSHVLSTSKCAERSVDQVQHSRSKATPLKMLRTERAQSHMLGGGKTNSRY